MPVKCDTCQHLHPYNSLILHLTSVTVYSQKPSVGELWLSYRANCSLHYWLYGHLGNHFDTYDTYDTTYLVVLNRLSACF